MVLTMIELKPVFTTKYKDFGYEVLEDGTPVGRLYHDGSPRKWGVIHFLIEYSAAKSGKWIPVIREWHGAEGFASVVEALEEFNEYTMLEENN